MSKFNLSDGVEILKGIGSHKKEVLKSIGISTLSELLYYFPRRYLDRNLTSSVVLKSGEVVSVLASVLDTYLAHGKTSRLVVGVRTPNNERISLVFFKGVPYFKNVFKAGMDIVVTGKLEYFRGLQIVHPDYEIISSTDDGDGLDLIHTGRIIPLYPSSESLKKEGLDSRGFRRAIKQILDMVKENKLDIGEVLPGKSIQKRKLSDRYTSFFEIHFPSDHDSMQEAKRRFAYEEIYFFHLLMAFKVSQREKIKRKLWPLKESQTANKLVQSLPFQLTKEQENSIQKIRMLQQLDVPMAVLLQGDVGSGKTVTGLILALYYIENNIQVCMVAPTEILARQHYHTIQTLLGYAPFIGVELFLGGEKAKVRREKLARLKNGETLFVIGTHSLFQDDVLFSDLGLVIIDEQHKFGVDQRESLRSKGKNPDILAMTATPIPRSLCLTLYGDLNLVTIKAKPKGRKPIVTKWFFEDKRQSVYNSIKKYIEQGRQCYIVYPLVEESEKLDLKSCIDAYESLSMSEFKDYTMGLLHGKMKANEKDAVMHSFKEGKINILVTTTVVEVGIDVPNATVLVIEHADRFGISQLHQLRGRVGRGEHESFCIFLTPFKVSEEAKVRLESLVEYSDGFQLAEIDMRLRGPGELLGVRQSGLPDFKIADMQKDSELIQQALEDVQEFGELGDLEKIEIKNRFWEGRILFSN